MAKIKELAIKINELLDEQELSEDEKFELFSQILSSNMNSPEKKDDLNMVHSKISGIPLEAILLFLGDNNVQDS